MENLEKNYFIIPKNNLITELFIENLERIKSEFGMEKVLNFCIDLEKIRIFKSN